MKLQPRKPDFVATESCIRASVQATKCYIIHPVHNIRIKHTK